MIDIMTRIKIHHMAEGGRPQADIAARCGVGLRSVQRVLAEPIPGREELVTGERRPTRQFGRPPKADAALVERIRLLLETEPRLPSTEVLRRAREWGFGGGRSQTRSSAGLPAFGLRFWSA